MFFAFCFAHPIELSGCKSQKVAMVNLNERNSSGKVTLNRGEDAGQAWEWMGSKALSGSRSHMESHTRNGPGRAVPVG